MSTEIRDVSPREIKGKRNFAWLILIGCCFIQAGGMGGIINTAGIFLIPITIDLDFGRAEFSLWLTILYLSSSLAMPFIARIINDKNFKPILITTLLISIAAFAATAFYNSVWQWYISGLILGVIGSFNFICLTPILMENWFYKKTGMAVGIAMACSALGGAIFSIGSTELIAIFGSWRIATMLVSAVVFAMVIPWAVFVLQFKPSAKGLLPYGYEESPAAAASSGSGTMPLEAGVPFKRAVFTFAFVALFIFAGIDALFGGYNSQFPGFALSVGLGEADGAFMLSLVMIGCVFFSVILGIAADRFGVAKATYVSLAVVAICLLLFVFVKGKVSLYILSFIFGMSGTGIAVCLPLLISKVFGKRDYAAILSLTRMGTGIIGSFGPALIALSFDKTGQYGAAFIGGIIVLAVCALLIFFALRPGRQIPWESESHQATALD
ncbi:MAG: MFS transporter [Coriobacteriales bacterium]|nr:MFS transporter [Coriobacteriales bacterium]